MRARPLVRRLLRVLWDMLSWVVATLAVVGSRYDFQLNEILWSNIVQYLLLACLLQAAFGYALMLYRGRYRIATFEEISGLALTVGMVGLVLAFLFVGFSPPGAFPRATAVLAPPTTLLLMAAGRWSFRLVRDRVAPNLNAERVLVYGAGDAGYQLLRLIVQDRKSPYRVVGFIDDAKSKRHLKPWRRT